MMNVRDMIDLLRRYPEDMRVVVNGYEQGYDDLSPEQISVVPITLNTGEHDWDGQHGDAGDLSTAAQESATTIKALLLRRTSN